MAPVVIPINTSTQFPPPPQFVHRRSDGTLHWVLGGVMPPELAAAREEEKREELLEHQRMWYVACTRARDLLVIPHLPEASSQSWSKILDLGHPRCPNSTSRGSPRQSDRRRLPPSTRKPARSLPRKLNEFPQQLRPWSGGGQAATTGIARRYWSPPHAASMTPLNSCSRSEADGCAAWCCPG